jgi:hypothetical protein
MASKQLGKPYLRTTNWLCNINVQNQVKHGHYPAPTPALYKEIMFCFLNDASSTHETRLKKIASTSKVPKKGKKLVEYNNAKAELQSYFHVFKNYSKVVAFVGKNCLVLSPSFKIKFN